MTNVICLANNKGGSGKSTTCSNLASALGIMGKKILLIDGDMQMNLSLSFFDEDKVLECAGNKNNLYDAVTSGRNLSSYILHTDNDNIDIIVSSFLMSSIELELGPKKHREFILRKLLSAVKESGEYDYILIDAPPTLGIWVTDILCASDKVIIPVEATPWGLFGLANMFDFLKKIREISPETELLGVLITKVDERKNYYKQTRETLDSLDDIHVFKNIIHVDSAVEWAQDASKTVVTYKKSSRSAKEYTALAKEILRS